MKNNKSMIIFSLATKTLDDKNDFLFLIITLKEEKIILEADIIRIRKLI